MLRPPARWRHRAGGFSKTIGLCYSSKAESRLPMWNLYTMVTIDWYHFKKGSINEHKEADSLDGDRCGSGNCVWCFLVFFGAVRVSALMFKLSA